MKDRPGHMCKRAAKTALWAAVASSMGIGRHASAVSVDGQNPYLQFKSQIDWAINSIRQSEQAVMNRASADIRHARAVPMDIGCTRTVEARCKALDETLTDLRRTDASDIHDLQIDLTTLRKDSNSDAVAATLRSDLATVQSSVVSNDRIVTSAGSLLLTEQATPAGQIMPAGGIGSNYCPLGTTYTWVGSASGSYIATRNWNPAGIPGSNDFMVVNQSKAATINMPASGVTVCGGQILSNTIFNLSGYNLAFTHAFMIVNGAQVAVEGSGAFSVNGTVVTNDTSTTLEVSGTSSTIAQLYQDFGSSGYFPTTMLAAGGAFQFFNNQHLAALTLTSGGTATMENESAIDTLEVAGNVSTDSTSTLTMGGNNLLVDSPGTFSNAGTFTSSGNVTASINNSGSFGITGSMLESNSYINTAGTTTISSALVIYPGGSYTQTGGTTNANSVVINPAGSYNQTGGTLTVGSLNSTGNFSWTGGTIQITSTSLTIGKPTAAAWAWGENVWGQLGNGTTSNSNSPVSVVGLSSGVTSVAAGVDQSLAVQYGGAFAWGQNTYGQLGNGTYNNSTTPVAVTGLSSGVTAVAGGFFHSVAVQNGGVYAWGGNNYGQLGNGTNSNSSTPVAVSGLSSGVTSISAGLYHNLAIQNGGLYAWGLNTNGQLGNGTYDSSNTPVPVTGMSSGVTAIAAGYAESLAIKNGALYAWGNYNYGQNGAGNNTPVAISGFSSGVTAVAAGFAHNLVLQNGNVYAWGMNYYGQLGNGTDLNYNNTPSEVTGITGTIVNVAATYYSSYALAADGSIWDWGYNKYGELGLGTPAQEYDTPQHLLPPSGYAFTSISGNADGDTPIATLTPVDSIGGNLTLNPSMSLQITGAGQSLNLTSTITLAGGSILAPVMTVQPGGVFNASAGTMTIGGALTVNSGGSYDQTGGMVAAGAFNASSASSFSFTGGMISMSGGTFTAPAEGLTIAGAGLPVLNLTAGAALSAPTGSVDVGAGGSLDVATGASVNAMAFIANGGFTTIAGGGSISSATDVYIAYATSAAVTVTGTNSKLSSSGANILIGSGASTVATVNVTNGGQITGFGSIYLGTSSATVNLSIGLPNGNDTGGSLVSLSGNLDVPNNIAQATVNVYAGGTLQIGSALNGNAGGEVNLLGGTINAGSLSLANPAEFNWSSGSLNLTGAGESSIGSLTIPAGGILNLYANTGNGILVRNLGAVTLSAGSAQMNVLGTSNSHSRQLIVMSGLTFAGTANLWLGVTDLANNDMDVQGASLANITSQIKQGYNGGNWNGGGGIVSTSAVADTTHLTTLGVIQNNQGGSAVFTASNPFDTTTPGVSDILVKYTYYGDANLDGQVDGSDYSLIDNGYNNHLTGWLNGDFNYDGVINGSDYTLIDNAFNTQGARLTAERAITTSQVAGASGTVVPEPAGLAFLTVGTLSMLRRRSQGNVAAKSCNPVPG